MAEYGEQHIHESETETIPDSEILIVLGKNRGMIIGKPHPEGPEKKDILSMESKMAALAAGYLYEMSKGKMKRLIFSGGPTSGPDYNSEAESMANYMRDRFPKIPAEAILLEEQSSDTPSNSAGIKQLLGALYPDHSLPATGLLASSDHMERARGRMEKAGIKARGYVIEEILKQISPHHARFINEYLGSPVRTAGNKAREMLAKKLDSTILAKKLTKQRKK